MTIITCTINTETHKVVPLKLDGEMKRVFNESISQWESFIPAIEKAIAAAPPYPADVNCKEILDSWISVDDRLPLEHAGVLISFLDQYQYPQIIDGFYFKLNNGDLVWHQNTEFCEAQGGWEGATIKKQDLKVTHWMPLPQPPAPKGE